MKYLTNTQANIFNNFKDLDLFCQLHKKTFYEITKKDLLRNKLNNMVEGRINDLTINLNVYLFLIKSILEKDKKSLEDVNIKKCLLLIYKTTRGLDELKKKFFDVSQTVTFSVKSYKYLKRCLVTLENNTYYLKNLL